MITFLVRLKLVNKWSQLLFATKAVHVYGASRTPTSLLLQRLRDVGLIHVLVVAFLRCIKLLSLTYVAVGTSLRRFKLIDFIYVPVIRRKDVSNRSISLRYQLRCRDDFSAWSTTSRHI